MKFFSKAIPVLFSLICLPACSVFTPSDSREITFVFDASDLKNARVISSTSVIDRSFTGTGTFTWNN